MKRNSKFDDSYFCDKWSVLLEAFIFIEVSETANSFVKRCTREKKNFASFIKTRFYWKQSCIKMRKYAKTLLMLIRATNWELSFLYQLQPFQNLGILFKLYFQTFQTLLYLLNLEGRFFERACFLGCLFFFRSRVRVGSSLQVMLLTTLILGFIRAMLWWSVFIHNFTFFSARTSRLIPCIIAFAAIIFPDSIIAEILRAFHDWNILQSKSWIW